MKQKYLFAIDLDGTLLKNSATGEVSAHDKNWITKATELGHTVMITTGRSWLSTKDVYEELGLTTPVSNFNGALVHNPSDPNFISNSMGLNMAHVQYILQDAKLKAISDNIVVEGKNWARMEKNTPALNKIFGFDKFKTRLGTENLFTSPLPATGVIIDTKGDFDLHEMIIYLNRKYGDMVEFSGWSKGSDESPVIDIVAVGANKGRAVSYISRYTKTLLTNTIALGDNFNDVPMFNRVEYPIAMGNANPGVLEHTIYQTDSNKESGVGNFIEKFLTDDSFRNGLVPKERIRKFNT